MTVAPRTTINQRQIYIIDFPQAQRVLRTKFVAKKSILLKARTLVNSNGVEKVQSCCSHIFLHTRQKSNRQSHCSCSLKILACSFVNSISSSFLYCSVSVWMLVFKSLSSQRYLLSRTVQAHAMRQISNCFLLYCINVEGVTFSVNRVKRG